MAEPGATSSAGAAESISNEKVRETVGAAASVPVRVMLCHPSAMVRVLSPKGDVSAPPAPPNESDQVTESKKGEGANMRSTAPARVMLPSAGEMRRMSGGQGPI